MIAATAFGDGPSGFSFDASLMEPKIPYSRSSSSMGLPGGYGANPRIHSGTWVLMSSVMVACAPPRRSHRARGRRVGTEDLEQQAAAAQRRQRPRDSRFLDMSDQVEEEQVFPGTLLHRPRFDGADADAVGGERL